MSNLSAFLAGNAIKDENIKYAASKRFVDENGKPMLWEIKSLTSEEDEIIRKQYTKQVPIPGVKNRFMQDFDANAYLGVMAAMCTAFPNLYDKELQDSYKVMGADKVLKVMLKPGEYQEYLKKVQEVNGFDVPMDEVVEEAKN